jgi:hypothetical protein
MNQMPELIKTFDDDEIRLVNKAVAMAEELVSNTYKMSSSEWLRLKYDVKTLADLDPEEIVHGPFAQIVRYEGQRKDAALGSSAYDFYKICIQDHCILSVINQSPLLKLLPFTLYITTHELIHIVRFSKFLQSFDASSEEKLAEEKRVHQKTRDILNSVTLLGLSEVFGFYNEWHRKMEGFSNS